MDTMKLLAKVLIIPGILAGFAFHEYAHALVADKLGDKTPRLQGRLTLNPFVHIDPIGFIMILIVNFGWAKPVQTNPSAYKNYYKDDLKVSIAGPIANLFVALLSGVLLVIFFKVVDAVKLNDEIARIISLILYLSVQINCVLFVLNLIPIPGFDGFHILRDLAPKFFYNISDTLYRYQFLIMIVFIVLLGDIVVGIPSGFISNFIFKLVDMI